jgi:sulfur carrier protein
MTEATAMDMIPTIRVNGEERPLGAGTVTGLLEAQAIDPETRGLAVAVNGAVVPRRAWPNTALAPGDEVEIVKLFAGG